MPDNTTDSLFQVHTENPDGWIENPPEGYGVEVDLNFLTDGETSVGFSIFTPLP